METLVKEKKEILAVWDASQIEEEDFTEIYWSDFVEEVQAMINKMRTKKFFAYGLSLTWRNVAGFTEFETKDAQTLIRKLAPNTGDYTMTFYKTKNRGIIEVVVSHHDKPMGETMWLMSQTMEKKIGVKEQHFN
jgi:hypothetical protein